MRPTAAQLSGRNSARSSRFAKSVASTIATSDGRPDPAHSVRHDRARPSVRLLAAPPPKGPASFSGGPTGRTACPPLQSPQRSLACRESVGRRRPLSGMRFWRRTEELMLNKMALATSLAILSGGVYLLFYVLAIIWRDGFRFLFNAQFFGADIASLLPRELTYVAFVA